VAKRRPAEAPKARPTGIRSAHRIYLWLLPWAGYLALLFSARSLAMPAVLTGWILLLVWQTVVIGAHDSGVDEARRSPLRLAWLLAPALLFGTQSWDSAGAAVANALIEITISEMAALVVCVVLLMILTPGEGKAAAWPGIVILTVFVSIFLLAYVGAWRQGNPDPGWLRPVALGSACLSQIGVDWRWLSRLAKKKLVISDPLETPSGLALILGQILIWLLAPVAAWLIQA
jgi:hypothetical protein